MDIKEDKILFIHKENFIKPKVLLLVLVYQLLNLIDLNIFLKKNVFRSNEKKIDQNIHSIIDEKDSRTSSFLGFITSKFLDTQI